MENLKNHFKKIKAGPQAGDSEKRILQRLVIPDRVIKDKYRSGVFYDFDPLGSHSSLQVTPPDQRCDELLGKQNLR